MKGGVPGKYPSFAETGFDAVMPCVEINRVSGAHFSAMTRPCCAGSVERRGIGTAAPSSRHRVNAP